MSIVTLRHLVNRCLNATLIFKYSYIQMFKSSGRRVRHF